MQTIIKIQKKSKCIYQNAIRLFHVFIFNFSFKSVLYNFKFTYKSQKIIKNYKKVLN